jgi:hypothetical protein
MTPREFIPKLKNDGQLQVEEYIFDVMPNNKVRVTDIKNMVCDAELYPNAQNAYFVYSYTLKQTDASRKHNRRSMGNLNFGNNSVALMEYKKELEKCK